MNDIFIGRQPIYDRELSVYAYELLFRATADNAAAVVDGDSATSSVLVNTFMELGLFDPDQRNRHILQVCSPTGWSSNRLHSGSLVPISSRFCACESWPSFPSLPQRLNRCGFFCAKGYLSEPEL